MERIGCGVIGLGWFGEHHVDTLKQLPTVNLKAICTRNKNRLNEIADRYDIPKAYTDYKELLADKDIEMVTIVTHVKNHLEPSIAAIKAGKHVFLEKPMASNIEECDKILSELKKTDKSFMVGHLCRFDSAYSLAKEEIDSGSLGEILSMYAKRNLARGFAEKPLNNISALFGDGIHDIDIMLWYSRSKPKNVYAQTMNTRSNLPNDDIGWAMFRLDNNAIAVIESAWCLPDNVPTAIDARMEIIGTKGVINIDRSGSHFAVITQKGIKYPESVYWPKIRGLVTGYLKEEFDYFVNCIISGKKPTAITPEESRAAVYAIEMAEKSAKENKIINFI